MNELGCKSELVGEFVQVGPASCFKKRVDLVALFNDVAIQLRWIRTWYSFLGIDGVGIWACT